MNFDPAVAAQQAFRHAHMTEELGIHTQEVRDAEEAFSAEQGPHATRAYETLLAVGERVPDARYFQEFLIYATWQQITEGPYERFFMQGLELSTQFLSRFAQEIAGTDTEDRVRSLRVSFQAGLGIDTVEVVDEHEEDAFEGGD